MDHKDKYIFRGILTNFLKDYFSYKFSYFPSPYYLNLKNILSLKNNKDFKKVILFAMIFQTKQQRLVTFIDFEHYFFLLNKLSKLNLNKKDLRKGSICTGSYSINKNNILLLEEITSVRTIDEQ